MKRRLCLPVLRGRLLTLFLVLVFISNSLQMSPFSAATAAVELQRDEDKGKLSIIVYDRLALVYQYAAWRDLPHYWPVKSPSGKNMLIEQTNPYPHHRSFWFADTVRMDQFRKVSTYNALYTGQKIGKDARTGTALYGPPFKDHVRHLAFERLHSEGDKAEIISRSLWEMDGDRPILDEKRVVLVFALGDGEYLLDMSFTLTAAYGDIEFLSDDVHYAWPYVRMHPRFSGDNGGILTSDTGQTGQEKTNMMVARWIDYSNTVEGITEGLAVFQWPDGEEHRWLTREYGCFGPRRPDDRSGKPFVLKKGDILSQRVGILVHKGDVGDGQVAQRYQHYISGQWQK